MFLFGLVWLPRGLDQLFDNLAMLVDVVPTCMSLFADWPSASSSSTYLTLIGMKYHGIVKQCISIPLPGVFPVFLESRCTYCTVYAPTSTKDQHQLTGSGDGRMGENPRDGV